MRLVALYKCFHLLTYLITYLLTVSNGLLCALKLKLYYFHLSFFLSKWRGLNCCRLVDISYFRVVQMLRCGVQFVVQLEHDTTNLRLLTQRMMCYTHKMAIVS